MPLFEYLCYKCNNKIEVIQNKASDPAPMCFCADGAPVEMIKQFPTGTSFQLKGPGWAKDGYSKK